MLRNIARKLITSVKRVGMSVKFDPEVKMGSPGTSPQVETPVAEPTEAGIKRPAEGGAVADVTKKQKTDEPYKPFKKKKIAMLLMYSGKNYFGMQKNPGCRTIESDLLAALVKTKVVRDDHIEQPGQYMRFQRAARTDKGVSAACQLVSFQMFIDVENILENLNSHLPPEIRVLGFKRTTKGFDCKQACVARTYKYLMPTFAFTPVEEILTETCRLKDGTLTRIQECLDKYKGSHNFHNFTAGKKFNEDSAKRYIMDFSVGEPFIQGDQEFVVFTVKGQSFMIHQIRKMIGMVIAIVRGLADSDCIEKAWGEERRDIPIAPGLGLFLDRLHYDYYNKKYGNDGIHEKLEWDEYEDQMEEFKKQHIYSTIVKTEKDEHSMLNWLSTLHLHHFNESRPEVNLRDELGTAMAGHRVKGAKLEREKLAKQAEEQATETKCEDKPKAASSSETVDNADVQDKEDKTECDNGDVAQINVEQIAGADAPKLGHAEIASADAPKLGHAECDSRDASLNKLEDQEDDVELKHAESVQT